MSDSQPTPDLATVLMKAMSAFAKNMFVALPGGVQSYDASTQTCSVQPLVQDVVKDETGTRRAVRLPVVTSVPVVFPGAGAYSITWPLSAGDTVLLVFSSSSIDKWLSVGGEVDPGDDRRHHITDAIAIAGLRSLPGAIGGSGTDDGSLVVSAPAIKLGSSSASKAALDKNDGIDFMAALTAAIAAAPATGVAALTALQTQLGSLPTATPTGNGSKAWPVGASKVLVE